MFYTVGVVTLNPHSTNIIKYDLRVMWDTHYANNIIIL